jgi:nuclear transcription Y subunit beta
MMSMTTDQFMSTPSGLMGTTNLGPSELSFHGQSDDGHLRTGHTVAGMLGYGEPDGQGIDYMLREQDRLLPIANVSRIMKMAVPPNAKISKEAKETMQECVSELISFITSEASDRCNQDKRKTINGEDIIWAMGNLGLDNYVQLLKIYLLKYKDV